MKFLSASIFYLILDVFLSLRELRHKSLRYLCRRYSDIHTKGVVTGNNSVQNQIYVSEEPFFRTFYSIAQLSGPRRVEYKTTRQNRKFSLLSREIYHRKRCADKDGEEDNPVCGWKNKESPSQHLHKVLVVTRRGTATTEDTFTTGKDVVTDKLGKPVKKSSHLFQ